MTDDIRWFASQVRSHRETLRSAKSPGDILARVATRVEPPPNLKDQILSWLPSRGYTPDDERFETFQEDFEARGNVAISSRGVWGRVNGSHMWFEVAAGYGAQRWLMPRLISVISSGQGGGAITKHRLKAVQPRQMFVVAFFIGVGALLIFFGMVIFLGNSLTIGRLAMTVVGVLAIVGILYFIRIAVPLARHMSQYLEAVIEDLAS
jgi:hypothetical protein